jgi:hypothetical protein
MRIKNAFLWMLATFLVLGLSIGVAYGERRLPPPCLGGGGKRGRGRCPLRGLQLPADGRREWGGLSSCCPLPFPPAQA